MVERLLELGQVVQILNTASRINGLGGAGTALLLAGVAGGDNPELQEHQQGCKATEAYIMDLLGQKLQI